MAIVNLSKTKMDHKADLIIHGKCDQVMEIIMKHLSIKVPSFNGPEVKPNSSNGPIQIAQYTRKRRSKNEIDDKSKISKT